ncbi:hypothetical protein BC03BB108_E0048 (plasmid) [Bacillus cereus 03BB108]|nr:hypothetical protein BC03BB108_E0048 [Bacillus cereus 03BB108]
MVFWRPTYQPSKNCAGVFLFYVKTFVLKSSYLPSILTED